MDCTKEDKQAFQAKPTGCRLKYPLPGALESSSNMGRNPSTTDSESESQ